MQFYDRLRFYPFIRFFIPFVTGIILGYSFHPPSSFIIMLAAAIAAVAVIVHICNKSYRFRWLFGMLINLLFLMIGMAVINIRDTGLERVRQLTGKELTFKAMVSDDILISDKSVRAVLKITSLYDDTINLAWVKISAWLTKSESSEKLQPGDLLLVKAVLKEIAGPKNPGEFDYKSWMRGRGILLTTFIGTESWKLAGRKKGPVIIISKLRRKVMLIYEKSGIKGKKLALLSALTLGNRTNLSDETRYNFEMSGAMHVLAVSGLHVGIIYLFFNSLLFFTTRFKSGKILRLIIVIITLWIFAVLTGLRPSVTRAAFMFSVIQTGKTLRKPPEVQNTIFFSAFFILLTNPYQVTDIGFQLSYLAVTGIVIFQPRIYRLVFIKNKIFNKLWELFTVSLAAQLVTAPLSIYYFHYFPVYFWLSNVAVVFLVGIIICLAISQVIFYFVHIPLLITGKALDFTLKLLDGVTRGISHFPGSQVERIYLSTTCMLLLYGIIILVTLSIMYRNKSILILSIIMILIFTANGTIELMMKERQKGVIVFNMKNNSAIGLFEGKKMVIISDCPDSTDLADSFEMKNYLIKRGIRKLERFERHQKSSLYEPCICFCHEKTGSNIFFQSGKINGLILNNPDFLSLDASVPLKINYIVLSHNVRTNIKRLSELFEFGYLILDSSNDYAYRVSWLKETIPDNCTLYSVSDSKAIEIETD